MIATDVAELELVVNGRTVSVPGEPARSLLHVLREELGLTAAKYGCGEGACGACTVLVDGIATRSCVLPIADLANGDPSVQKRVETLEGLAGDRVMARLQDAFVAERAMQCGYCIPGMLVAARALLEEAGHRDRPAILDGLDGNVCRCGTYSRILRAVERAARAGPADQAAESRAREGTAPAVTRRPDILAPSRPRRPWDLTPPGERDFFEILGDGLMVVLSPEEAERIGPQPAWSTDGGAWLHVSPEGRITAFTGKVDVGQDNQTALRRIVAEQLDVPMDAVGLVMGDTDLCPADIGTFGSRSTTDAGRVLALCAAAAREALEGSALRPGERRLVEATADTTLARTSRGDPPVRVGTRKIVDGTRRYGSDLHLPGMLHGAVLRPPGPQATLRSATLDAARARPGVVAVREDGFVGVAAADPLEAGSALDAIQADWDVPETTSEGDLAGYLRDHPVELGGWEGEVFEKLGDVDRAIAEASLTLETTYTTAYIAHVPLEARCAIASWSGGRLTVWVGTQRPFGVREDLAEAFDLPAERVRVIVPPTGSAYGGKHGADVAIEAARLARAAERPVKVRWSRHEEFSAAYFRPAAVIDVRSAAGADGSLVAWDFRNINSGAQALDTPYAVPNRRIAFQATDSPLPIGSYRALSATANCFARESHMDELARALATDPLGFRLRHLRDQRLSAVFQTAADRIGWPGGSQDASDRGRAGGRGIGIAGGIEKGARVAVCVELRADGDRPPEIVRIVEAVDCGRIVDRDNLTNQVEGAIVMGLGGALFEAIHFAKGRILNGTLSDYRVPRFRDVPPIEVVLLDQPNAPSAGAGETPIIPAAPAIANAYFAATGRRLRDLPLFPDGS